MELTQSQFIFIAVCLFIFIVMFGLYILCTSDDADEPYLKFTPRPTPTIPVIEYTKGSNGDTCFLDKMCESGKCDTSPGKYTCVGPRPDACQTQWEYPTKCEEDCMCKHGRCARKTADDDPEMVCCKQDKTNLYGGFWYCGDMPDGARCWSDAMCASGTCEGNAGGFQRGNCKTKKNDGEECDSNNDCKNDKCGRGTAADGAGKICCPAGRSLGTYGGFDYCYGMPDNSVCWSDAMCASGICSGNAGGFQRGTCQGKRADGEACNSNSECHNNKCGRDSAADGAGKICCTSGRPLDTYGGFDYCYGMPNGSVCWSDSMCASGTCEGNAGGFQRGTCKTKLGVGAGCNSNSDCANNACGRGTADDNAPKICCPSGGTQSHGFFDYCTGMGRGSRCWLDGMCASGNCKGNLSIGLQRGRCT